MVLIFSLATACTLGRYTEQRLAISQNLSIPVSMIIYAKQAPDWDAIYNTLNLYATDIDYRVESNTLWQLNHNFEARLSDEVLQVLKTAIYVAEISNGAFDPTILPLVELWDIQDETIQSTGTQWQVPSNSKILEAKAKVNYRRVAIGTYNRVAIPRGTGIDLGGIAKGAIVDKLADYLISLKYKNFLIEAGGDILVNGLKPVGKEWTRWTVAIRHPRQSDNFLTTAEVGEAGQLVAIVTSGDYERFVEVDGKRYHHIINPATGYPAVGVVSATVIAPNCTLADALSTAVFVMGYDAGTALLEKMDNVEGMLVREQNSTLETRKTTGFPAK